MNPTSQNKRDKTLRNKHNKLQQYEYIKQFRFIKNSLFLKTEHISYNQATILTWKQK